ncbi:MAG: asparagine synthase (glutamine-hydrolyzing) [Hyphomicrobiaceae bacterium]|nr:asparagine synthase (glutamine-hydrolyzing) [Hyphomicrobiaceae bacterium]
MCGIAGFLDSRLINRDDELQRRAKAMGDSMVHRGPDGMGVWVDEATGLALSHRRLAIVDLSPGGAQPMVSADGRFVVCYNGEVYNAEDLRSEPDLRGHAWRGHSDTEVILELAARRGLEATVPLLNGMFAIAMWDRKERVLHLARDRIGIKPLFYAPSAHGCAFASELKALLALGERRPEIDGASLASYLRFGYVPAPHTIFLGVRKLLPGEMARVGHGTDGAARTDCRRYWNAAEVARAGIAAQQEMSDGEAVRELTRLLGDAVSRQMMGDVPLGAFLSGGIDSSTVVALMVAARQGPVRTFSIGFDERGYDESQHAAAVARHLGTQHTELKARPADALALVPQVADFYDEPFGDSSQIPTMLVSKLTRAHVTVALSGDGGDELFAGYNRYRLAELLAGKLGLVPTSLRKGASSVLRALPAGVVNEIGAVLPGALRMPLAGDKAHKLAQVLPLSEEGIYWRLVSQNPDPDVLAPGTREHAGIAWDGPEMAGLPTLLDKMQLLDTVTYLPDDIMQKVDRASMAFSLEARPPLLDHRVVELAWRLPRRFKVRNGETKWILRRVLDQFVPRALIDRPKTGFGIPVGDWLRGPLRAWVEDLLDPRTVGGGLLDGRAVGALWAAHNGPANHAAGLWTILMFEAWRRRWAQGA